MFTLLPENFISFRSIEGYPLSFAKMVKFRFRKLTPVTTNHLLDIGWTNIAGKFSGFSMPDLDSTISPL